MRIKSVGLKWFRGASHEVSMDANGKSLLVYGENGSGKSSFVDAIECAINEHKIKHLSHEYSGRRQEKAIPNTHKPEGQETKIGFKFQDDSSIEFSLDDDCRPTRTSTGEPDIETWDYNRTVLRQDEVAEFIHGTKGVKYSTLLPLLGLSEYEAAAENLHQLQRSVRNQSNIDQLNARLQQIEQERTTSFEGKDNNAIGASLRTLYTQHSPDTDVPDETEQLCNELTGIINAEIAGLSSVQQTYVSLRVLANLDLQTHIDEIQTQNDILAKSAVDMVNEKLRVLISAKQFAEKLTTDTSINCPACGQLIQSDDFIKHVQNEEEQLSQILQADSTRRTALARVITLVNDFNRTLGSATLAEWREKQSGEEFDQHRTVISEFDIDEFQQESNSARLSTLTEHIIPVVEMAKAASKDAPPEATTLNAELTLVQSAQRILGGEELSKVIDRLSNLIATLDSVEKITRAHIRTQSEAVIDQISDDIQRMWGVLHPSDQISDVKLYIPEDADKAIDIGLSFYGTDQDSPRLTLSEGNRNGLGLCIYLAMAKQITETDRPIILDDVVISLDRFHRGMIAKLLQDDFPDRQVIILTHDREWYAELRHQLDQRTWIFKTLRPYEAPEVGIRWSDRSSTFDDARAQLADRPDGAGNDARKIMDVELSLIAERLQLKLQYLRGLRNDHRMAHDYLERIIADGQRYFQHREEVGYEPYEEAIRDLRDADRLLQAWGNRASHTFDLVRPEAEALITACERALDHFKCTSCGKTVWFAEAIGPEDLQCQCGSIRWRYGRT